MTIFLLNCLFVYCAATGHTCAHIKLFIIESQQGLHMLHMIFSWNFLEIRPMHADKCHVKNYVNKLICGEF